MPNQKPVLFSFEPPLFGGKDYHVSLLMHVKVVVVLPFHVVLELLAFNLQQGKDFVFQ